MTADPFPDEYAAKRALAIYLCGHMPDDDTPTPADPERAARVLSALGAHHIVRGRCTVTVEEQHPHESDPEKTRSFDLVLTAGRRRVVVELKHTGVLGEGQAHAYRRIDPAATLIALVAVDPGWSVSDDGWTVSTWDEFGFRLRRGTEDTTTRLLAERFEATTEALGSLARLATENPDTPLSELLGSR